MKSKLIVHVKGIFEDKYVVNTIEIISNRQNKVNRLEHKVDNMDDMVNILLNKLVDYKYELDMIIEYSGMGINLVTLFENKLKKRGYNFNVKTGEITKSNDYNDIDAAVDFMMKHKLLATYADSYSMTGRGFGKTHTLIKKALEEDIMIITGFSTTAYNMTKYANHTFGKAPIITFYKENNFRGTEKGRKFFVDENVNNDEIKQLINDHQMEFMGGFSSLQASSGNKSTLLDLIEEKLVEINRLDYIDDKEEMLWHTLVYAKKLLTSLD